MGAGGQPPPVRREDLDLGLLDVVLVGDLPDDLLEQVLDGDQAGHAAVLVDDHRQVHRAGLHLAQQVVGRLALGNEHGCPHDVVHGSGQVLAVLTGPQVLQVGGDVLEVRHPDHVVRVAAHDRDPAEARAQVQPHGALQAGPLLEDDHVGARHLDLAGHGVAEVDDALEHEALAPLDDGVGLGLLHELDELGLGGERPGGQAAAGDDDGRRADEQPDQRPDDGLQPRQRRRRAEGDGVGVLLADRAPRGADQDEEQRGEHRAGEQHDHPVGADHPGEGDDDRRDRPGLADGPGEARGVVRGRGVLEQAAQGARVAPAGGLQVLGVAAGHPGQGRLDRGEPAGQDDEQQPDAEPDERGGAHGCCRGRPRNSSRSRRCRANISASSSGSAWS